jgi:hypothetical protein
MVEENILEMVALRKAMIGDECGLEGINERNAFKMRRAYMLLETSEVCGRKLPK